MKLEVTLLSAWWLHRFRSINVPNLAGRCLLAAAFTLSASETLGAIELTVFPSHTWGWAKTRIYLRFTCPALMKSTETL